MKTKIYWITTVLLSLMMLMSAGMYIFDFETMADTFNRLGYPSFIIIPFAIAKILGVIAILTRKSELLKEWAYAGFFFDFLLAFQAHLNANDGGFGLPIFALVLLLSSYNLQSSR